MRERQATSVSWRRSPLQGSRSGTTHLPTCPPAHPSNRRPSRALPGYQATCLYTKFKHASAAEGCTYNLHIHAHYTLANGCARVPCRTPAQKEPSRLGRQDATMPGLARPRRPPLLLLVYLPRYCCYCINRPLIYPWLRLPMRLFGCLWVVTVPGRPGTKSAALYRPPGAPFRLMLTWTFHLDGPVDHCLHSRRLATRTLCYIVLYCITLHYIALHSLSTSSLLLHTLSAGPTPRAAAVEARRPCVEPHYLNLDAGA